MVNQHRFRAMAIRPDPDLRDRVKEATRAVDSNVNAHVLAFFHWLVHDTDELPPRPDAAPAEESKSERAS